MQRNTKYKELLEIAETHERQIQSLTNDVANIKTQINTLLELAMDQIETIQSLIELYHGNEQ